ncbi:LysR family transcriptional regulator [Rhodoferax aquaticus]|uniref:LysR family transcriptional regulator n=1 Tax=Rhodoferax aquaticus TaxID=2527691 RepID=A0A515ET27_9BURK|nr:LysR family transcriptional regulator [Rhodoferax aquaticus]QDL55827.1 LysR family transcriptional regulator [Rhodoferax aquaticus]
MNTVEHMQIFSRVAELASFTQAASSMDLPKATVSTAIAQLEATMGTRLLHRTTRKVQLTHDGQAFYERCKDVLADLDELQTMFQLQGEQALRGRVRIDMSSGIARHAVLPQLPALLALHPLLELELSCTERRVDIVREGFDCVLRAGPVQDSSLVARHMGAMRMVNCASPAYLSQRGLPATLADLAKHTLVHYANTLGSKPDGFEYAEAHGLHAIAMHGAITVNNADAYSAACLAGLGIIQVPHLGVKAMLDQGQLVEILPQYRAPDMPLHVVYANRRNVAKRVRVVMDWLAEVLQAHLETPETPHANSSAW